MPFSEKQLVGMTRCFERHFKSASSPSLLQYNQASQLGSAYLRQLDSAIAWAQASTQHHLVSADCAHYPIGLKQLHDAPPVLYVRGALAALSQLNLAVVGSRRATALGLKIAQEFSNDLCNSGLQIVSGLALGIDTAAHRGALQSSQQLATVAVLGNGLLHCYPKANHALAEEIVERGCLVSELPLTTSPTKFGFPRRNRLIAALSKGAWIVEAALKSGSLVTARQALDLGREVFATPGPVISETSRGCHLLIKEGAKLVEAPHDILEELKLPMMDWLTQPSKQASKLSALDDLFSSDTAMIDHLGWTAWWPDQLPEVLKLDFSKLANQLLEWEMQGLIKRLQDGRITRA